MRALRFAAAKKKGAAVCEQLHENVGAERMAKWMRAKLVDDEAHIFASRNGEHYSPRCVVAFVPRSALRLAKRTDKKCAKCQASIA